MHGQREVIAAGSYSDLVTRFTTDGRLILNGIMGPDGAPMNVDMTGHDRILGFLNNVGAPPDFGLRVDGFSLSGDQARQTGVWWIGSEQGGAFTLDWRRSAEVWQILHWRLDASRM